MKLTDIYIIYSIHINKPLYMIMYVLCKVYVNIRMPTFFLFASFFMIPAVFVPTNALNKVILYQSTFSYLKKLKIILS